VRLNESGFKWQNHKNQLLTDPRDPEGSDLGETGPTGEISGINFKRKKLNIESTTTYGYLRCDLWGIMWK
jgi:hypothetical protein